jgi:hypothetical protein
MSNRTAFIHMAEKIIENGKDLARQKEEVLLQAMLWSSDDENDAVDIKKAKKWSSDFWNVPR